MSDRLQDYIDGRLSADECAAFEKRLRDDPRLAQRLESARSVRAALREETPELSAGFYARARRDFEAGGARRGAARERRGFHLLSWEAAGLAAAAVLALVVFMPHFYREGVPLPASMPPEGALGQAKTQVGGEAGAAAEPLADVEAEAEVRGRIEADKKEKSAEDERRPLSEHRLDAGSAEFAPAPAEGNENRRNEAQLGFRAKGAESPEVEGGGKDAAGRAGARDADDLATDRVGELKEEVPAAPAPQRMPEPLEKNAPEEEAPRGYAPVPSERELQRQGLAATAETEEKFADTSTTRAAGPRQPAMEPAPGDMAQRAAPGAVESALARRAVALPRGVIGKGELQVLGAVTWGRLLSGETGNALAALGPPDAGRRLVLVGARPEIADCAGLHAVSTAEAWELHYSSDRAAGGGASAAGGCALTVDDDGKPVRLVR